MEVMNLEVGVRRALRAFLVSRGNSEDAAEIKTEAHLAEAVAFVKQTFSEKRPTLRSGTEGDVLAFKHAFSDLKAWAVANIE